MRTLTRRRGLQAGLAAVSAVAAVALSVTGPGATAQAAQVRALAPVRTTTLATECTAAVAAAGPDGSVHAFAKCNAGLLHLTRVGSSWTRTTLPGTLPRARALAVADDGVATYLLADQVPIRGDGRATVVARIDRRGKVTKQWTLSTTGWSSSGAITARKGAWWVVWSERVPGVRSPRLFHAETGGGGDGRPAALFNHGENMTFAWNGTTLEAAWTSGGRYTDITVGYFKGRRWETASMAGTDDGAGSDPSITTTRQKTVIAFQRPGSRRSEDILLATRVHRRGARYIVQRIDNVTRPTDLHLTSRGERLALAWTDDPATNGFGTAAVRVGNGSTWAVRRLGAGSRVVGAVWPGPKLVVLRIVQAKGQYGPTTNLVADQF